MVRPSFRSLPVAAVYLLNTVTGIGLGLLMVFQAIGETGKAGGKQNEASRDWPMLGGTISRNMANLVDKNLPSEWSVEKGKEKNIKWVARLGDKAYGGPVISGGKVFVGTNNYAPRNPAIKGAKGILMCFRESDGKFLWQAVHPLASGIDQEALPEGLTSTPVIEGNRVFYVSNGCEVICADIEGESGKPEAKIIWRLDMMKVLDVFPHKMTNCSPLIAGDFLFVCTSNGVDDRDGEPKVPSPQAPSFIAVNKKTGKVAWQDNSPGKNIMLGQWSSPAYAVVKGKGQVIFGGGDGWLRGFEAETGKPIWKFDCNPKSATAKAGGRGTRNYLVATPVVYDNKVYVGVGQEPSLGSGVGHLWCVDITKTGDLSPVNDNFDPKAPENKDSGLVWHYGGAVDQATEDKIGRKYLFGRTVSSCAIHDGLLYIGELTGYLHCLDAKTGVPYWVYDTKGEIWGSPYWVDGKVLIGTGDGDVHILVPGKEMKLLGKIDMSDGIYTAPVAANGILYVMTRKNLYAIGNK
jgi:outer membrane protein assembly factor BamB